MRATTYYNIAGTKFLRLASKKFFKKGTNLQNIDKHNRRLYKADEGKILNQRDQSGAEALVVAYLCRDGNFRSLFKNGIKPHVYVALHLFKDVWQNKINEGTLDIQCSIEEMCNTPIPLLPKNPYWKTLNKLIKSSDEWPPSERYYYLSKQTCHCVDENTEVLTRDGWIYVNDYDGKISIKIYNPITDLSFFEIPNKWNIYDYAGKIYNIYGDDLYQAITPNHKIPLYDTDKNIWITKTAESLIPDDFKKYKVGSKEKTAHSLFIEEFYEGKVYCPTVSTGMFYIRKNGYESITHNSGNYDITAGPFVLNILEKSRGKVVIPKKEGARFIDTYHSLFPEIRRDFQYSVSKQVNETGILYNLLGYPIIITADLTQTNALKECYSAIPQSTVACITREAVTKMQDYIEKEKLDWDLLQDNHDSFVVQCPIGQEITCHTIMKSFLNKEMKSPVDGEIFTMQSEGASGFNWMPFNETKNPEGLKEIAI